jgi:hypothetical protein
MKNLTVSEILKLDYTLYPWYPLYPKPYTLCTEKGYAY